MKKKLTSVMVTLVVSGLIIGCGSSSSTPSKTVTYNGTFVDAGTQGLDYTCGTFSGVTGVGGVFGPCKVGDPITFKLGTIIIGTIKNTSSFADKTKTIITPRTIEKEYNSKIANIASKIALALQSLDSDGDPTNGITISDITKSTITKNLPGGTDLTKTDIGIADAIDKIKTIISVFNSENASNLKFVDQQTADKHLENTEKEIIAGTIKPTVQPSPTTGATGAN